MNNLAEPTLDPSGKTRSSASVPKKPEVVCVCGSSRFISEIAVISWELEKLGKIVLGMHLLPPSYTNVAHHLAEDQGVAAILDEVHLRKIDMADWVLVVNPGGYVGERTQFEIDYALRHGKVVEFTETPNQQ